MPIPKWVEKWIEQLDDPVTEPIEQSIDIGDIEIHQALSQLETERNNNEGRVRDIEQMTLTEAADLYSRDTGLGEYDG